MDLRGKVAFVTGGSGDIGAAIVSSLARAGADVALSYIGNEDGARSSLALVEAEGRQGFTVQLDQRDTASIAACADKVLALFGRLDILVNNAAWNIGIPFADVDLLTGEIWDRVLETNLRGPYLLCRAFAPELKHSGRGRIVNIASLAGVAPTGSSIAYAVSKAGLVHLTRCLAVALAPSVTVNCIAPGLVEGTRMADRLPEKMRARARTAPVLGVTGNIDDIAAQVITFCGSQSVTGQILIVDGGLPIGMR